MLIDKGLMDEARRGAIAQTVNGCAAHSLHLLPVILCSPETKRYARKNSHTVSLQKTKCQMQPGKGMVLTRPR
jgi:hypothetical protein